MKIDFAPMYSAFITDSTDHSFLIPAIVDDGSSATWTSSSSDVQIASDPTTGGVLLTVTGTSSAVITATEGSACGTSQLNITSNTEDQWTTGNARYNDGVTLTIGAPGGGGNHNFEGGIPDGGFQRPDGGGQGGGGFQQNDGGSFLEQDGGTACTNCHGATGDTLFKDVQHTPEQTGGFSDTDLIGIITAGTVPENGYFDPSVINTNCTDAGTNYSSSWGGCAAQAYKEWQAIHKWSDIDTDAEKAGIIVYLRSLTPTAQTGSANFGGGNHNFGDGGTHHHDGGGGGQPPTNDGSAPPPSDDSGTPSSDDAATD